MHRRDFLNRVSVASASMLATSCLDLRADLAGNLWRRDGSGWRARIGVITPDNDPVPESEFWTLAPEGVSVHAARAPLGDIRMFANQPAVDDATELLARLSLKAIVFAFTTSSYVQGTTGEESFKARLQKRAHGVPVLLPCQAAVEACQILGVRRIALIHPPWFPDAVNQAGTAYFRGHGFEVTSATQVHPVREFTEVHPGRGLRVDSNSRLAKRRSRFRRRQWFACHWCNFRLGAGLGTARAHGESGCVLVRPAPSPHRCDGQRLWPDI